MKSPALLVLLLALTASACGSDNSPTSPGTTTQPTTLNFSQVLNGGNYYLQDVTVFQSPGNIRATATWADGRKDIDLYWTNAFCTISNFQFIGTGCQVMLQSIAGSGTSEQVAGPAAAGSTVRLFMINFSSAPETVNLTVTMTPF